MECKCPSCQSSLVKKNGRTYSGKQNYRCLACDRQFVQESNQKIIDDNTKSLVKKALLERVSLQGICRIFDVSMPWLLELIDGLIADIPRDLNAEVVRENDEIEVVVLQADELWSYVGAKTNPQWLWLVMHSRTRQVVAMEVGARDKATAERLFYKLPELLKKKSSATPITSLRTSMSSLISSTDLSAKNLVKRLTLKDLTARSDSVAQDL